MQLIQNDLNVLNQNFNNIQFLQEDSNAQKLNFFLKINEVVSERSGEVYYGYFDANF